MTWSRTRRTSCEDCARSSLVTRSACCVGGERLVSTPSKMRLFIIFLLPVHCSCSSLRISSLRRRVPLPSCFAYRGQECLDPFLFPDQCRCSGCMGLCSHGRIIMETEEHDRTLRNRCTQRRSSC